MQLISFTVSRDTTQMINSNASQTTPNLKIQLHLPFFLDPRRHWYRRVGHCHRPSLSTPPQVSLGLEHNL